jgi:hypothetical protein
MRRVTAKPIEIKQGLKEDHDDRAKRSIMDETKEAALRFADADFDGDRTPCAARSRDGRKRSALCSGCCCFWVHCC